MSGIIVTIVMIAFVLVAGGLVWSVVNGIIGENIDKGSSCFGFYDKLSIERKYTCYTNNTDNITFEFQVSRKDVVVDGVLVAISGDTHFERFTLTGELQNITNLFSYSWENETKMPGKDSGVTYILNWTDLENFPTKIEIIPIVGKNQCEVSDTLSGIEDCNLRV